MAALCADRRGVLAVLREPTLGCLVVAVGDPVALVRALRRFAEETPEERRIPRFAPAPNDDARWLALRAFRGLVLSVPGCEMPVVEACA